MLFNLKYFKDLNYSAILLVIIVSENVSSLILSVTTSVVDFSAEIWRSYYAPMKTYPEVSGIWCKKN